MADEIKKSVVYETLKKVTYDNIQQFVEDINRNFALIQNSPLYKGIPGNPGDEGDPGLRGIRGTRYFFVEVNAFNKEFPGEILNGSVVTLNWLNTKLQNFVEKNKLLKALGTDTLVDTDIIVLTNSMMIQYILLEDILKDTGIAFNQQSNLVSSIETKIEQYVKYYVDNHPAILAIQNIFEHYITYAKNYTSTNNTYITNAQTKSSVYMPYFAGITDTQGVRLNNHKYFGFADKEFPESNGGTIVFGSMKRYCRLMLTTLSTTTEQTFTSDYAPGENNIPSAIFLQDTDNACLMFGRKMAANLKRFGMIFKDKDDNLVIKSDMGYLLTDSSSIILNKNFLKYAKEVHFDDNLNLGKDFLFLGNTNNKFYRTAEYIWNAREYGPTSLAEGTQDQLTQAAEKRRKIMEVGYYLRGDANPGGDAEYRNYNETIQLSWFVSNVLVTDDTGKLLKSYFIEKSDITTADAAISPTNIDDLLWSGTPTETNAVVTSNYIETLIKKINASNQYIKVNYWRKDQFAATIGANADIPSLYLHNELRVNKLAIFGPQETPDQQYFIPSIVDKTLTLGSKEATSKIIVRSNEFQLSTYNVADIVLTTDGSGNFLKTFHREKTTLTNKSIAGISASKEFDVTNKYLTSNYFQWLTERLNDNNINLASNYWRKEEYSPITAPMIPNLWLVEDLKCRYITVTGIKTNATTTTLDSSIVTIGIEGAGSKTTILSNELFINSLLTNAFVVTDGSKKLTTPYIKETVSLPVVTALEQIDLNITTPETHILTSTYLLWLNNRINKVIGSDGLTGLYWKKSEFKGYIIPDLELSGLLTVRGDIKFGVDVNPFIVTTISNKTIEIGQSGDTTNITLNSDIIKFKDTDFASKVLVTDTDCNIRKDITMSNNTNATEAADNIVPVSTDDTGNLADAGAVKTKNWHHIITGQQMDWIHTFMNVVKKRFVNTFNRKETIDQMYKHFPVGGIVMWTYGSSLAANIPGAIPEGFAVCDGTLLPNTNIATPDMRNMFVRGASSIADANGITGNDQIRIFKDNLPSLWHSHTCQPTIDAAHVIKGKKIDSGPLSLNHTRTARDRWSETVSPGNTSIQLGGNDHIGTQVEGDASSDNEFWKTNNTAWYRLDTFMDQVFSKFGVSGGEHQAHTHTLNTTDPGGNTTPITIIPAHYKVLYIMKYDTRINGGTGFNEKYLLVP